MQGKAGGEPLQIGIGIACPVFGDEGGSVSETSEAFCQHLAIV